LAAAAAADDDEAQAASAEAFEARATRGEDREIEGFYAHLVENGRKTDNENDMALYCVALAAAAAADDDEAQAASAEAFEAVGWTMIPPSGGESCLPHGRRGERIGKSRGFTPISSRMAAKLTAA
jgi:hypothetical protein